VIEGPEVVNRFASMHHDNQCSFSANEIDQELKEGIDRKGLAKSVFELAV
jgi:hypothetical protein